MSAPGPGPQTPDEIAAARMVSGRVEFLLSAPQLKFLPEPTVPEVALAGRSNVGKSSLLNALTMRRGIARASVTPGRTQELNIFEVGAPTQFRLGLVRTYVRGRSVLARTLVLVDSRHGLKDSDRAMMKMLDEAAVGYRIVLTKSDKIKASALQAMHEKVAAEAKKHPAAYPEIHLTSAEKGQGIAALRAAVVADALTP